MDKFIFHEDEFGVYVFYAGMNLEVTRRKPDLRINRITDFDPLIDCVVPPVTSVSSVSTREQVTGYRNKTDRRTMTEPGYCSELQRLINCTTKNPCGIEEEVAANVALRRFESEWEQETKTVTGYTDYEFEVIKIKYPADERLIPLRHFDNEQVNYFRTNGESVALNLAHQLCKDAGLKHNNNEKRDAYWIPGYQALSYWSIEGERCGEPTQSLSLKEFTGTLDECRDYINKIERCVRSCFDEWVVRDKQPKGLTVGKVTKQLDKIKTIVKRIESKIKTRNAYNEALATIDQARQEIIQEGIKASLDEENSDYLLDNHSF